MELNPFKIIKSVHAERKVVHDRETNPLRQKQIMACIIDMRNIDIYTKKMIQSIKNDGTNIDFHGTPDHMEKNRLITARNQDRGSFMHWSPYVISSCDKKDKYSTEYSDCTGIIIVGRDKSSNANVSVMSHQLSRGEKLTDKDSEFYKDLLKTISNFQEQVDEDTIDAVIFGGLGTISEDRYKESITSIADTIKNTLGLEPLVLTGPNFESGGTTEMYFDTKNRRAYLVRPEQSNNSASQSYLPSDITNQSKKWPKQ